MYRLAIKPRAIEMAKKAYQWYEEQQAGLGDLFASELESCYDRLETSPSLYAKIKGNYRQIILKAFPYVLVFEISHDEVIVYTVFHTRRSLRKEFKK